MVAQEQAGRLQTVEQYLSLERYYKKSADRSTLGKAARLPPEVGQAYVHGSETGTVRQADCTEKGTGDRCRRMAIRLQATNRC